MAEAIFRKRYLQKLPKTDYIIHEHIKWHPLYLLRM
jgi:hypothetical protein